MRPSVEFQRARTRVLDLCDRVDDARDLRRGVLVELARVMNIDGYVWLLTDPETSVGTAPLADVPSGLLPHLPWLIALKYSTEINRWTSLSPHVATLDDTTGGDLARSRLWRDLLSDHGIVDIASCVFRDRFGCWGFLDLWRGNASMSFDALEREFLTSVLPAVTRALRRCQADTFHGPASPRRDPPGPLVLLLSPRLDVLGQTPDTHEYLRRLVPPEDGRAPIPASAYNVGAQLLAVEAGVDANRPAARVHLAGGLWVSLRAARIGGAVARERQDIAVTIEECSPSDRVPVFGRACGLTEREIELLGHLRTGADTKELACLLHLSAHTVQDHLKSIFAKSGTRNRRSLLSRVSGT